MREHTVARQVYPAAGGVGFFKGILRHAMAFGMKRTRHQFAPAVPVQKIIDSAVAGGVPDGLFVGCFEIMDVQHLAGTSPFGKTGEQGLFLGQRHILVLAATIWLGLERFDAALVIGHVPG